MSVAAATPTYSLGQPVELGRVERELKNLWEQGEGAMTRASLMNFAVFSSAADSLEANTQIVSHVTADHACRAIVVAAATSAADGIEAWINTHCHLSRAGEKQVCSEQISLRLGGAMVKTLPSVLFAHLDSDLPLYLWWQDDLREIDLQLWPWIDRLIFDSQRFDDPYAVIDATHASCQGTNSRAVLCDLNWTRIVRWRQAFAQFFDHPSSHHHFDEIASVEMTFGSDARSTALLFIGWLAAQLKWKRSGADDNAPRFENADGRPVQIALNDIGAPGLQRVRVGSGKIEFVISAAACGDRLEVARNTAGETRAPQLLPALDSADVVRLLDEELSRGGPHRIYLRALAALRATS